MHAELAFTFWVDPWAKQVLSVFLCFVFQMGTIFDFLVFRIKPFSTFCFYNWKHFRLFAFQHGTIFAVRCFWTKPFSTFSWFCFPMADHFRLFLFPNETILDLFSFFPGVVFCTPKTFSMFCHSKHRKWLRFFVFPNEVIFGFFLDVFFKLKPFSTFYRSKTVVCSYIQSFTHCYYPRKSQTVSSKIIFLLDFQWEIM